MNFSEVVSLTFFGGVFLILFASFPGFFLALFGLLAVSVVAGLMFGADVRAPATQQTNAKASDIQQT